VVLVVRLDSLVVVLADRARLSRLLLLLLARLKSSVWLHGEVRAWALWS
jgi:hypothetical protein